MTPIAAFLHTTLMQVARARQRVGWPGLAGVVLLLAAGLVLALAWPQRLRLIHQSKTERLSPLRSNVPQAASPPRSPASTALHSQALPTRIDIPLLTTQIEYAVLSNGLKWPSAEYRMAAATPKGPARLDVHFTLKGAYPSLRRTLVQVLTTVPGSALQEISMSRSTSEASEVEAKIGVSVFLADDPSDEGLTRKASR